MAGRTAVPEPNEATAAGQMPATPAPTPGAGRRGVEAAEMAHEAVILRL